jgi:hypothetical protein
MRTTHSPLRGMDPSGVGYNRMFPSADLSYNSLQQQVFGDNYGLHSQVCSTSILPLGILFTMLFVLYLIALQG